MAESLEPIVNSRRTNVVNNTKPSVIHKGTNTMLQRMSDNHGFTIDVIKRLYDLIGNFERTDAALKIMRESAEAEAISFISTDVAQVDEHLQTSRHPSPRRVSDQSSALLFTPAPVDTGNMSDYSPPETSRAAQYARLARQGLRHEALKREGKKVSLGGADDFVRSIRMSDSNSSRATSGAPAESMDRQSPAPAFQPVDHMDTQEQPIPGEEQDRLLLSGNTVELKELELMMGGPSFKRRIAEILGTPQAI